MDAAGYKQKYEYELHFVPFAVRILYTINHESLSRDF